MLHTRPISVIAQNLSNSLNTHVKCNISLRTSIKQELYTLLIACQVQFSKHVRLLDTNPFRIGCECGKGSRSCWPKTLYCYNTPYMQFINFEKKKYQSTHTKQICLNKKSPDLKMVCPYERLYISSVPLTEVKPFYFCPMLGYIQDAINVGFYDSSITRHHL